MTVLNYLTFITPFQLLIGIVMGFSVYKRLDPIPKFILYFLVLSLGIDFTARIMKLVYKNNLILINILSMVEIIFFSAVYFRKIKFKKFVLTLATLGTLYSFLELFYVKPFQLISFQPYAKVVSSFLVIIFVLVYLLQQLLRDKKIEDLNLNFVLLFYFIIEFVFLLPINFWIQQTTQKRLLYFTIRLFVALFFYGYLIRYIWKSGKILKPSFDGR